MEPEGLSRGSRGVVLWSTAFSKTLKYVEKWPKFCGKLSQGVKSWKIWFNFSVRGVVLWKLDT